MGLTLLIRVDTSNMSLEMFTPLEPFPTPRYFAQEHLGCPASLLVIVRHVDGLEGFGGSTTSRSLGGHDGELSVGGEGGHMEGCGGGGGGGGRWVVDFGLGSTSWGRRS